MKVVHAVEHPIKTVKSAGKEISKGLHFLGKHLHLKRDGSSWCVTVPTYVHVIQQGNGTSDGHISYVFFSSTFINSSLIRQDRIQKQIQILNAAYKRARVQFKLAGTTWDTNQDWYNNLVPSNPAPPGCSQYTKSKPKPKVCTDQSYFSNSQEMAAKKKLQVKGVNVLNIYITSFKSLNNEADSDDQLLGYGTYPWRLHDYAAYDGVMLSNDVIPGTKNSHYNGGKVAVHEVAHWLGILHPFEGTTKDVSQKIQVPLFCANFHLRVAAWSPTIIFPIRPTINQVF